MSIDSRHANVTTPICKHYFSPLYVRPFLLILDVFELLVKKQTSLSFCVSRYGMTCSLRISLGLLYLETAL